MAFTPSPDTAMVVLEYTTESTSWTNTLYFSTPGLTETLALQLVDYCVINLVTPLMAYMSSATEYQQATVYDMTSEVSPKYVVPYSGTLVGAGNSQPMPLNAALVATFYSNTRGRSGRGRNYVSGFPEADIGAIASNGVLFNNLNTVYGNFLLAAEPSGTQWVIYQRRANNIGLNQAELHPVTSAVIRNARLGSQRRRTRKF